MTTMEVKELWYGSVLNPQKLGFLFEEDVPEDIRREAEIDENLHRLDMDWIDNCLAIADVHQLKKAKNTKWGYRQTAAMLGEGYGKTNVNYAVRIARALKESDKDILACKSMDEAINVFVKRNEDKALAELHRRAGPTQTGASTVSFLDTVNMTGAQVKPLVTGIGASKALDLLNAKPSSVGSQAGPVAASAEAVVIPLSRMLQMGDCITLMKELPDASFHHVVTDIPYGIDMANLTNVVDVREEHDVEENAKLMQPFLEHAFRLTKPHGFCVFFYDLDYHERLQAWAREVGWRVQRWPFYWVKTHNCKNNSPQYNFTKSVETAMVLRRDEKTVLRVPQNDCVYVGEGASERKLYNNPFAKPFGLWKRIYDSISFPGQSTFDPFCGEMSACCAAVNCGLVPFGMEIKESHYRRGLEHIKAVYALLYKSNVKFI